MSSHDLLLEALELVVRAIDNLDQAKAPADIAAHLDMARTRIDQVLSEDRDPAESNKMPLQFGDGTLS